MDREGTRYIRSGDGDGDPPQENRKARRPFTS